MTHKVTVFDRFSSLCHYSGSQMLEIGYKSQITPCGACLGVKNHSKYLYWCNKDMKKWCQLLPDLPLTPRTPPGQSKMTKKSPRPDTYLTTGHYKSLISTNQSWSWSTNTQYCHLDMNYQSLNHFFLQFQGKITLCLVKILQLNVRFVYIIEYIIPEVLTWCGIESHWQSSFFKGTKIKKNQLSWWLRDG